MNKIYGKKIQLSTLVDYQKGSIVSKELIKERTGSITLFAFDKGQGLSEHTVSFNALVYVVQGEADIFISGRKHSLKAGDMIVMPKNKPHALKANKRFKMLLIMIRAK